MLGLGQNKTISSRFTFLLSLGALLWLFGACDGTPLPEDLGSSGSTGSATSAGSLAPLEVELSGFVGGDPGDGSASAATAGRNSQSSLATNSSGQVIAGANGVDLKDLGWNNLYSDGLANTPLPGAQIQFFIEGDDTPLTELPAIGSNGSFSHGFDAREVQTGGHLELEMTVADTKSRIMLPLLNLHDGDQLGFNAIRRQDGTLIVELFVDSLNNESLVTGPDGLADNGIRIVVDNGTDINGDGTLDTAARMDTADGLSFFDLNLDGRFGDPVEDALTYLDIDSDDFAETPFILAGEADQAALNEPETVSFLFDPELDGTREEGAERDLGAKTESDLIEDIFVQLTPESLSANGVNTATLRLEVLSSRSGLPLDAQLAFGLERDGGELAGDSQGARFIGNEQRNTSRLLSPEDPEIRLLSDGTFLLSETFIVPSLLTSSVTPETGINTSIEALGRAESEELIKEQRLFLTPSNAPQLSQVNLLGQVDISSLSLNGLENISRTARLVWGDSVEVVGENFASQIEDNIVSIDGILVDNLRFNNDSTGLLFEIPEGAETGPISVVVNGLGGKTSQNLVIAGPDFVPEQISPEPGSDDVAENSSFSIQMNRPVDSDTALPANFFIREAGTTTSLDWYVSLSDSSTLILTREDPDAVGSDGSALSSGTDYEIVLSSNLLVEGEEPGLHFDADPSTPLATGGEEQQVVATYTVVVQDLTAPSLVSSTPADQDLQVDPKAQITLVFDEAINVASVADAIAQGNLRIVDQVENKARKFSWRLNATLDTLTLTPREPLEGGSAHTLEVPGSGNNALRDLAGNAFNGGADLSIDFTTALAIRDISPRSGPVGSSITVFGGNFGTDPSALSLSLGGETITEFDSVDEREIVFTVPDSAQTGVVEVSVGGETATSPTPFTITLPLARRDLVGSEDSKPIGIAISNDDSRFFVSNQGTGSIAVYNLDTLEIVDADNNSANGTDTQIQVGSVPSEVKLSRDGKLLLSLDYGLRTAPGDSFFVVDASASVGEPENERYGLSASVPVGKRPTRIATSPDDQRWYVTNFLEDSLSVISAEAPYSVVATVPTGDGPNGIGISPDGTRGYVCNFLEGSVTVFDTIGNEPVGTVLVGAGPARARVSPNGRWVFVSCFGDSTLHVIDVETNQNLTVLDVNAAPSAMAFSRTGDKLYVCSRDQDTITIFDIAESTAGDPIITEEGNIAAGRIPSGVAVTADGSRLVVTNEGDGFPSVIFLQDPVQTIIDIVNPLDGRSLRFADVGQSIDILGEGFAPDPLQNTVLFSGNVTGIIDEEASDRELLRVMVPEGALSGPLTVSKEGNLSNSIDFLIAPDQPKILRTTPPAGALGVAPDASIIVRFNEPVVVSASDFELRQMEDSLSFDSSTQSFTRDEGALVSGSISLRDFGREVVFTPDAPLTENPNSNNVYRFTIFRTVTDFAGKPLEKTRRISFRLADTRGPSLLQAFYLDVDGNGLGQGDIVDLLFDEVIVTEPNALPLSLSSSEGGATIGTSDSTTFGSGAQIKQPSLSGITQSSDLFVGLSRSLTVTLGSGANILVPGSRTAVSLLEGLDQLGKVGDASGNVSFNLSDSGGIDIQPRVVEGVTPRVLAIVIDDTNGNDQGDEGEVVGLYCNQPLNEIVPLSPTHFEAVSGGDLGSNFSVGLRDDNKRVIEITLGSGASLDPASHSIETLGAISDLVSFDNIPLQQLTLSDGVPISAEVPSAEGPQIDVNETDNVVYVDSASPVGPSAGDKIIVVFNEEIQISKASAGLVFSMAVEGDRFGRGAFIQPSSDTGLTPLERARRCEIVLGSDAFFRPDGNFSSSSTLTFGSSSGLDVNPDAPQWALADVFGNTAVPDPVQGPFGLKSADDEGPSLVSATLKDQDQNGQVNAGDQITVVFDEPVRRNAVSTADFELFDSPNSASVSFGSGAVISRGANTTVAGDTLVIQLGSGTTLPLSTGVFLSTTSSNPISDFSGNLVQLSEVQLSISVKGTPELLAVAFDDNDSNGVDEGDKLYVLFNQVMVLDDSLEPDEVFELTNSSDSFGFGASMEILEVTSRERTLGITEVEVGQNDPRIVEIELGSGADLFGISGLSSGKVLQFVHDLQSDFPTEGDTSSFDLSPVGLCVRPHDSFALSKDQLEDLFSDPSFGDDPLVFENIEINFSNDTFTDVSLKFPNDATAFDGSAEHFRRIVNTFNSAFLRAGKRYRAFFNTLPRELVIFANGESGAGSSGDILILEDRGQSESSFESASFSTGFGLVDEITNLAGFIPVGQADIQVLGDNTSPSLLEALFDPISEQLLLTFSEPVEIFPGLLPTQLFDLPVAGDSFGLDAFLHRGESSSEVIVQLGSSFTITASGDFDISKSDAGEASGIGIRTGVSAGALSDFAANPATNDLIDISSGGNLPTPVLSSVIPAIGSAGGGTLVTLFGTGFLPTSSAQNAVTFGTSPATEVITLDDGTITCRTPAGTPGEIVDVTIENLAGSSTLTAGFTYSDAIVESANPSVLSASSSLLVGQGRQGHASVEVDGELWGDDYDEDFVLIFGGQNASGSYLNDLILIENDGAFVAEHEINVLPDPSNGLPEPRSDMVLAYYDYMDQVLLFGGRDGSQIFDDVWCLMPVSNDIGIFAEENASSGTNFHAHDENEGLPVYQWRLLSPSGAAAPARWGAVGYYAQNAQGVGALIIIGGSDNLNGDPVGADPVQVLDFSNMIWLDQPETQSSNDYFRDLIGNTSLDDLKIFQAAAVVDDYHDYGSSSNDATFYIFGGVTDTGVVSDVIQVVANTTGGVQVSIEKLAANPNTTTWEFGDNAAAGYIESLDSLVILGGRNDNGDIGQGGSIYSLQSGEWLPIASASFKEANLGRFGASFSDGLLAFGNDGSALLEDISSLFLDTIDSDRRPFAPLAVIYEPKDTSDSGTSGVDLGEEMTVVFNSSLNLNKLGGSTSFNETDLSNFLAISDGSQLITDWPSGTSASVETTHYTNDTLRIILGDPSTATSFASLLEFSDDAFLDFTNNGEIQGFVLTGMDNELAPFRGFFPIAGSISQGAFYRWTGAGDEDPNSSSNWLLDGSVPSQAPGASTEDIIFIDTRSPVSNMPIFTDPLTLHQFLFLGRGALPFDGDLTLEVTSGEQAPKLVAGGGALNFQSSTTVTILDGDSSSVVSGSRLIFGNLDLNVGGSLDAENRILGGNLEIRGNTVSGDNTLIDASNAFILLSGSGNNSFFGSFALGDLFVAKESAQDGVFLGKPTNGSNMSAQLIAVLGGKLDFGQDDVRLDRELVVLEDGSVQADAAQTLHVGRWGYADISSLAPVGSVTLGGLEVENPGLVSDTGFASGQGLSAWDLSGDVSPSSSAGLAGPDSGAAEITFGPGGSGFAEISQVLADRPITNEDQREVVVGVNLRRSDASFSNFFSSGSEITIGLRSASNSSEVFGSSHISSFELARDIWKHHVAWVDIPEGGQALNEITNFNQLEIFLEASGSEGTLFVDNLSLYYDSEIYGDFHFQGDLIVGSSDRDAPAALFYEGLDSGVSQLKVDGTTEVYGTFDGEFFGSQTDIRLNGSPTAMIVGQGSRVGLQSDDINDFGGLQANGDFTVEGELFVDNIKVEMLNSSNNIISVEPRASLSLDSSSLDSGSIQVQDTATNLQSVGLATDPVQLSVTSLTLSGAPASFSSGAAFLRFEESDFNVLRSFEIPSHVLQQDVDANQSGTSNDLDGIQFDFDGDSFADVSVSTATGNFSGSVNTPGEVADFATAMNLAFASLSFDNLIAIPFESGGQTTSSLFDAIMVLDDTGATLSGHQADLLAGGDSFTNASFSIETLASDLQHIFLADLTFDASSSGSASPLSVNSGTNALEHSFIMVHGFSQGTGFLDFNQEDDPENTTGNEAESGRVIWKDQGHARWTYTERGEQFIAPGTANIVLDSFAVRAGSQDLTLYQVSLDVQSTLVDSDSNQITNFRLAQDVNANGLFDSGTDLILDSIADPGEDDPTLTFRAFNSGSGVSLSSGAEEHFLLLADIGSDAPVGSFFTTAIKDFDESGSANLSGQSFDLGPFVFVDPNNSNNSEAVILPGKGSGIFLDPKGAGGTVLFGVLSGATTTNVFATDSDNNGILETTELEAGFNAAFGANEFEVIDSTGDMVILRIGAGNSTTPFALAPAENVRTLRISESEISGNIFDGGQSDGFFEFNIDVDGDGSGDSLAPLSIPASGGTGASFDSSASGDYPALVQAIGAALPADMAVYVESNTGDMIIVDAGATFESAGSSPHGIIDAGAGDVSSPITSFPTSAGPFSNILSDFFFLNDFTASVPGNFVFVDTLNDPSIAFGGHNFDFSGRTTTIGNGTTPTLQLVLWDDNNFNGTLDSTDGIEFFGRNLPNNSGTFVDTVSISDSVGNSQDQFSFFVENNRILRGVTADAGVSSPSSPLSITIDLTINGESVRWVFKDAIFDFSSQGGPSS